MDIDKPYSEVDDGYEEAEDDNDEREVPSEQNTDEANSKGESGHMKIQSNDCDFIHTQCTPCDFGASPMHAKVLDFASSS